MLATVSCWDRAVMLALSHEHGIPIPYTSVKSGFDWRSKQMIPDLAQTFGTKHIKDRDLFLAREAMWTYYRARKKRGLAHIPSKLSDKEKFQEIRATSTVSVQSVQVPGSPVLLMMPPDHIQSSYVNRNKRNSERMQRLLEQVPVVPQQAQEPSASIPVNAVNSQLRIFEQVLPEGQRQSAREFIRRNAQIFQNQQEEGDSESGDSSDPEYCQDWGENGDKSSSDDDS
jgi:hypothetical protein